MTDPATPPLLVIGLLGPNGCGKTRAAEALRALFEAEGRTVIVADGDAPIAKMETTTQLHARGVSVAIYTSLGYHE